MKLLKLLQVIVLLITISACHHADNPTVPDPAPAKLEGEWKLVRVSGGIAGIDDNFPEGLITWKINAISHTVMVVNNNTNEQMQDILPSGTYPYGFEANDATPELCAMTIRVDGVNLGCYTITATEFTMNQIESDGFMVRLVR